MQVNVTRSGNLLEVIGPVDFIEALAGQLTYFKQVFERREAKFKSVKTVLYKKVDATKLIAPSGFTKRIYTLATNMGLSVTYKDLRKLKIPDPDFTRLQDVEFREGQAEQLVTICANDHGIIWAPTGYGKSEMITWICRVYPTSNIIVCAQQREVVKSLYKRIDKVCLNVGIVGDGYNHPDRITVSTAKSLMKAPLNKCDILLYDEAHTAPAEKTKISLSAIRDARKYGFTASPYGRHDRADLETEAMFGPVICEIKYQDAVKSGSVADIEVLVFDVYGNPVPYEDTVAKERWGFWRNKTRNSLIRDIGMRLPSDEQALIIVLKVEHGLYLKKLLPDWEFVYGNLDSDQEEDFRKRGLIDDSHVKMNPKNRDVVRERFESGELKRAIATGVWNVGVDFKHLQWLIRADGGVGEIGNIQTPGRLSRVQNKSKGYLIDFHDRFDPGFSNRSLKRLKSYESRGWTIRRMKSLSDLDLLIKSRT